MMKEILTDLGYKVDDQGIYISNNKGYWSNLSKEENKNFVSLMDEVNPRAAVQKAIPHLEGMIFSEEREAALELINLKKDGVCIDYGCMWGVMSVGMAKRGQTVLAIDQTYDSLHFLKKRREHDKLNNIYLLQNDIKEVNFKGIADYALVNGVLEWIPEVGEVDLTNFYGVKKERNYKVDSPRKMQLDFLKRVSSSLKEGGEMLLAIENRYDYQRFIGKKDPHANLFFTTFLPRFISNFISKVILRRPYRNYIYSFKGIEKLVKEAGFKTVELNMGFPDYHFPAIIAPYSDQGVEEYKKYQNKLRVTKKQKLSYYFEYLIMKHFKMRFFSPAIILKAKK
jgi:cyclopropane fatty-acyl-phospholipid synthase-like methyltransferase